MRRALCILMLLTTLTLACKPQPSLPTLDDPALTAWARAMITALRPNDPRLILAYFARVAEDSPRLRNEYAAAFASRGYARELYAVALANVVEIEDLTTLEAATWPIFWAALEAPTTERM